MNDKEDVVKEQCEAWASTYDRDEVEIIRKDTGIELEEFVDHILDNCQLKRSQEKLDVGIGTGLISVSISIAFRPGITFCGTYLSVFPLHR